MDSGFVLRSGSHIDEMVADIHEIHTEYNYYWTNIL